MDYDDSIALARAVIGGEVPDSATLTRLARTPDDQVLLLLPGADMLRRHRFGNQIHLCTICNGKSGRCTEDCRFCAQSAHYDTGATSYPLMEGADMAKVGLRVAATPVNRYSVVTTGRGLGAADVPLVAGALATVRNAGIGTCASLGILEETEFACLRAAGVDRYHHNLETAESFFPSICTTHAYAQRVATIRRAKRLGFSVCAGGIFGMGETDDQALEMLVALRDLKVDAVPLNFLVPIDGTPLAGRAAISPLRCLKLIALARFVMPGKEIIVCGGREANLKDLHPLVYLAGASGIMTGHYLTTTGRRLEEDLGTLSRLGLTVRSRR